MGLKGRKRSKADCVAGRAGEGAETPLSLTLQRLEAQLANSPLAVIELDPEYKVIRWSAQAERMFGWTAEDVLGKRIVELPWVYPDDAEDVARLSAEMASGQNLSNVHRNRNFRKDGSLAHCEWYNSALLDENGKLASVLSLVLDVTDRTHAQQKVEELNRALERRIKELETLLDVIPAGIAIAEDPQCRFVRMNRAFAEWSLVSPGENVSLTGPNAGAVPFRILRDGQPVPPDSLPIPTAARRGVEVPPVDLEVSRADGRIIHIFGGAAPLFDEQGQPRGAVGAFIDVTDRKRAEAALRESEARFRRLVEASLIGVAIGGADGAITYANDAYLKMVGYSRQDLSAGLLDWTKLTPSEWSHLDQRAMDELRTRGSCTPYEKEHLRKDGSRVPVFMGGGALDGAPARDEYLMVVLDLSVLKETQRALAVSQERVELATRASGIGTFDWNRETGEVAASAELVRLFGLDPGGAGSGPEDWLRHLDPNDRERAERAFQEWIRLHKSGVECEFRIIWPDGGIRWIGSRAKLYYGRSGELLRVIGTAVDLTEHKRAEEAIRQKQKLESIGLLAGGVAHDFNNLLVGIVGGASLMRDMLSRRHPALPVLDSIEKAGEQAAHLTRQLLAYAGKGRFYVEKVDVAEVARTTCELLRSSIPGQVRVEIDCEPGAPKVEADIGQIQQLVMNLLINAAEAIGTAQPGRIGIRIGGRRVIDAEHAVAVLGDRDLEPGWYAYVEVTDTGCGMDEETVSKIFDPFFTTKFTGRGLGLAAVQGIVRGNKGAIRVTSEPGKGATFAIYLPAVDFYGVEKSAACPGTDIILVADDEEVVCRIAEASLRRGGYEAHTVREGKAAASFFRQNASRVRLVLLDMSMPGMSGREILLDIRHARSEVPVIVTSGYSEAEVALEFEGLDIAGFLQKPFTAGEIVAKVEEVLNARRGSGSGDSRVV